MKYLTSLIFILLVSCSLENRNNGSSLTVIVYANGDNNLESSILSDINEWESVYSGEINIIVLVDRSLGYASHDGNWSDTRSFEITYNDELITFGSKEIEVPDLGLKLSSEEEINLGDPETLSKFIDFVKREYPSDKYALIISGHGDGWFPQSLNRSISYDRQNRDELSIKELKRALDGHGLDLVCLDACNMGVVEVIFELQGVADYIVASPYLIPVGSFNNKLLYNNLKDNLSNLNSENLARLFVNSYHDSYYGESSRMFAYSVRGISQVVNSEEFKSQINNLILNNIEGDILETYTAGSSQNYINILSINPNFEELFSESIISAPGYKKEMGVYFPMDRNNYNSIYDSELYFTKTTEWPKVITKYHLSAY